MRSSFVLCEYATRSQLKSISARSVGVWSYSNSANCCPIRSSSRIANAKEVPEEEGSSGGFGNGRMPNPSRYGTPIRIYAASYRLIVWRHVVVGYFLLSTGKASHQTSPEEVENIYSQISLPGLKRETPIISRQ
ncbi:jg10255 [Pararge aegeria aegeria]|uniref:Jg10255 protein n=1 Tax=Pararge aegeria aegeria TaxID=348720 RepID=A0A8S4SA49_9NEOP|nr:jg10255 [Pararge aegeria aegeria]